MDKKMSLSERLSKLDPEDPDYPDVMERRAMEEDERKESINYEFPVNEAEPVIGNLNSKPENDFDVELRSYSLQVVMTMFEKKTASIGDVIAAAHEVYKYVAQGKVPETVSVSNPLNLYVPGKPEPDPQEDGAGWGEAPDLP